MSDNPPKQLHEIATLRAAAIIRTAQELKVTPHMVRLSLNNKRHSDTAAKCCEVFEMKFEKIKTL
ncbi:hypothetical protein SAMN05421780_101583 [Flexibacter flexilis DSM 6793]|uniref:Uncharacterized protein n=1 Tax=Flexibacter flexilis DSM 6793 TaxID=927664 RepID=A0A1I1E832_9BACT|nr:hypothetical protein [Flexibacter flexilis]SFB81140.1 hypothetical protein SAMN05421780_101583 [Flexibacter flexilis DSM 6793]